MSYAVPTPPPKTRPGVVQTAVYLMWAVVALNIAGILLSFVPTPELDRALDEFYAEHPELRNDAATMIGEITSLGLAIVLAVAFAVLAIFVARGSQPARITTWVVGGLVALCQVCGLISTLAAPALLENVATGDPASEAAVEQARIALDKTPAWLNAASTAILVLTLLAILAVIILLAVPKANDYFRKEEEVWVPPTGSGGGYPQYPPPAIPQNPGAPPAPPAPPTQPPTPPTQS